jgi:hypothetical protein
MRAAIPLLALSGRSCRVGECPLSGEERTRAGRGSNSANDPKQLLAVPNFRRAAVVLGRSRRLVSIPPNYSG